MNETVRCEICKVNSRGTWKTNSAYIPDVTFVTCSRCHDECFEPREVLWKAISTKGGITHIREHAKTAMPLIDELDRLDMFLTGLEEERQENRKRWRHDQDLRRERVRYERKQFSQFRGLSQIMRRIKAAIETGQDIRAVLALTVIALYEAWIERNFAKPAPVKHVRFKNYETALRHLGTAILAGDKEYALICAETAHNAWNQNVTQEPPGNGQAFGDTRQSIQKPFATGVLGLFPGLQLVVVDEIGLASSGKSWVIRIRDSNEKANREATMVVRPSDEKLEEDIEIPTVGSPTLADLIRIVHPKVSIIGDEADHAHLLLNARLYVQLEVMPGSEVSVLANEEEQPRGGLQPEIEPQCYLCTWAGAEPRKAAAV